MTDDPPDLAQRLASALGPQYRLERELGRGGMGVVFLARDTALDRAVAVKVIHPELAGHESITRRFLDEARTIARLRHPNIVAVHSAGSSGDLLWYVMDQVPGETLRARLDREARLPPEDVARITADLAGALDAAGKAGVVHRDVKPENVLLEAGTGRPLLADFGIARAMEANNTDPRTALGVAVGTPTYMSPEQASGDEVDTRSDLYSLGIVAYEMLTGKPPFLGPQRLVVSQHLSQRPTPVRKGRPEASPALADAIMRSLEKNPAERWQTGAEFRAALLGQVVPRRRGGATARRRVRMLVIGVGAVFLLGVGAVALFGRKDGPPAGVNPRLSLLVLPFNNLRNNTTLDWLRDGSVSMLALNLSQWNDLQVVGSERLHDLLGRHDIAEGETIGLDMARRLARDAGVWTVVMGDFDQVGDSLHLTARMYDVASGLRVETAQTAAAAAPGQDVRSAFDDLAARLLDLSNAPSGTRTALWEATTSSLEAFRAYLQGVESLNNWDLAAAEQSLKRATDMDSTFGLAYYKYALTRGWLVGADDSLSTVAMARATAHSAVLPQRQRTIISAYSAFLDKQYSAARGLYKTLIARDSNDTDAWYGLGDAWYHDMGAAEGHATAMTESLRAFRKTLALDPSYVLAYEHVEQMLTGSSREGVSVALMPNDSFVPARDSQDRPLLDSAASRLAARRAQDAVVALARNWVATQPTALRAHSALVDAFLAAGDFPSALSELTRIGSLSSRNPELPFMEARVRFAAGNTEEASRLLRQALDSAAPEDFAAFRSTPSVFYDVAAAANVFAYQGDVPNATRAIEFAARVQSAVYSGMHGDDWRRMALGQLFGALGTPEAALRSVWQTAAESARVSSPDKRQGVLRDGAAAAVGLFTGLASDSVALAEYAALSGEAPPVEIQAWQALARGDSARARRLLSQPDSVGKGKGMPYMSYFPRPMAAQVHAQLGDYTTALNLLDAFEPDARASRGFDARWGLVGRVRLLRGEIEARLGHKDRARQEYQKALAQWKNADSSMQEYVKMARLGLAALGEAS